MGYFFRDLLANLESCVTRSSSGEKRKKSSSLSLKKKDKFCIGQQQANDVVIEWQLPLKTTELIVMCTLILSNCILKLSSNL